MFTLDAVIAILVLIVGTSIVFMNLPSPQEDFYIDRAGIDVIGVLSQTLVSDLCTESPCGCGNYDALTELVCDYDVEFEQSILDLYAEHLARATAPRGLLWDSVQEIFIDTDVIDERRFGLALLVTLPEASEPVELYATGGVRP